MTRATHNSANLRQPVTNEDAAYGHGRAEQSEPTPERKNGVQFLAVSLFVLLCSLSASAQRGAVKAIVKPPTVATLTLTWRAGAYPDTGALSLDTTFEHSLDMLAWSYYMTCYTTNLDMTQQIQATNQAEFFRAYSE